MRLQTKLLAAQFPLGFALALVAGLSLSSITTLGRSSRDIVKDNHRSVLAAQRMMNAVEGLDSGLVFRLLGRRREAEQLAAGQRASFELELAVAEGNVTEPDETLAARKLHASWGAYVAAFDAELRAAAPSADRYATVLFPSCQQVRAAVQIILDVNQDAIVHRSMYTDSIGQRLVRMMTVTSLLAMVLGLLTTIELTRRLLRPLDSLTRAARRLGEGDVEIRATVDGAEEIALLATEFNHMAARVAEYRRGALGELQRAQKASQAAIDSIPYPVLVLDLACRIISVNQVGQSVLGLGRLAPGQESLGLVEPALRAALEAVHGHVVSGKGSYTPRGFEEAIPVRFPEGTRYLLPRATPIYGDTGSIAGASVVLQDVTRLRRFDELKNDLVATVAHEFRTPLTSLHLAIHICLEEAAGPVTTKQSELLHAARQDCERLQGIVEDLLNLARLQAGPSASRHRRVSAPSLLSQAAHAHEALARERGVEITSEVIEPADHVNVDPESIQSVFSNLIANALEHTNGGGKIHLRALRSVDLMRFEVRDTGPGIAPEHVDRVFEKFYRVGADPGGAGLGLAIAKEIVERQDGRIGVDTQVGRGSTFWFVLPCANPGS